MQVQLVSFLLFLTSVAYLGGVTCNEDWNDFRVTYGIGYYNQFPKLRSDAENNGWQLASPECTNGGTFHGFRMQETSGDRGASLLFDVGGHIAGIQMLTLKSKVITPGNNVSYAEIPMYQTITVGGEEYFILTAYFVPPQIICTTGRNDSSQTGTGLWLQNGPSIDSVVEVPMLRADAISQGWTQNQCFPGMGSHNFYQVEKFDEQNCELTRPAFGLYNKAGELLGFGFIQPGLDDSSKRFEYPPAVAISAILGAPVPQCILDQNAAVGHSSMHVFFVDFPSLINCL